MLNKRVYKKSLRETTFLKTRCIAFKSCQFRAIPSLFFLIRNNNKKNTSSDFQLPNVKTFEFPGPSKTVQLCRMKKHC